MKTRADALSSIQMAAIALQFVVGTSLMLIPGSAAKSSCWIATLLGSIEGAAFVAISFKLSGRFPGKTPVEIYREVGGPIVGSFFSICHLWFLFQLGSSAVRNITDYVAINDILFSQGLFVSGPMLILCAYIATRGAAVIGRLAEVATPVLVILFAVIIASALKEFSLEDLLPIADILPKQLIWATHQAATIPFGQVAIISTLAPQMERPNQAMAATLKGLFGGATILVVGLVTAVGLLGHGFDMHIYPWHAAARTLSLGAISTRLDLASLLTFYSTGIIKVTIILYALLAGIRQTFHLKKSYHLAVPIVVLMGVTAHTQFSNVLQNVQMEETVWPIYSLLFIPLIPLIVLVVSYVKGPSKARLLP